MLPTVLPLLIGAVITAAIFLVVPVVRAWFRRRRDTAEQQYRLHNPPATPPSIMRPARIYFDRKTVGECSGSCIHIGPTDTCIEADILFFEKPQSVDFVEAVVSDKDVEVHILLGNTPYVTTGKVRDGKVSSDWKTGTCAGSFSFTGTALAKVPAEQASVQRLKGPSTRPALVFAVPTVDRESIKAAPSFAVDALA